MDLRRLSRRPCCRPRPSGPARPIHFQRSAKHRFPAPRPDSVMTWQASCSMFRARPAAIWRSTSPPIAAWQFFMFAQDKWAVTPKVDRRLRPSFGNIIRPGHLSFKRRLFELQPDRQHACDRGAWATIRPTSAWSAGKRISLRDWERLTVLTEKTVIRVGFGISYTPFPGQTRTRITSRSSRITPSNPTGTGFRTCGAFQPASPPPSKLDSLPPTPAVIPSNGIITNPDVNQAYIVVNTNFKNPYVESWNFAIQQSLPKQLHSRLGPTFGNHGVDSVVAPNINAAPVVGLGA